MVGVPGRSKGCKTCRTRRVRCDEAKPTCQRCIKAGFECLGYERPTLWRNTYTNYPAAAAAATAATSRPNTQISKSRKSPSPSSSPRATPPRGGSGGGGGGMLLLPPRELSFIAFQWDMYVARMFDNFIWRSYGAGWLDQAAQGNLGDLSLDAVRALSQFSFGQSNRTRDIQTRGDAQYGKCIRVLLVELQTGASLPSGGHWLICPILILTMVACIQTDRGAAFSHLSAVARVLKVCGPEPFQQPSLRNAFEAARSTLLVASLSAKRRLFLEEHRWRTVPWLLEPASKRPQSRLLDILVTVPGILQEERQLSEEEDEEDDYQVDGSFSPERFISERQLRSRITLCNKIAIQLEELYRWRWDWQRENGRHVVASPSPWHPSDPAWTVLGGSGKRGGRLNRLLFDSPTYANDIMLYNAALIWLMALLWKIDSSCAPSIIEDCAKRATRSHNQHQSSPLFSSSFSSPTFIKTSPSSSSEAGDDVYVDVSSLSSSSSSRFPYRSPNSTLSFEPLEPPGVGIASLSIRGPAIEICRAYDWQSQHHRESGNGNKNTASSSLSGEDQICLYLFPLGVARGVLDTDSRARDWIRDMLGSSPVTRDYFGAGSNVAGFRAYVTQRALYPDPEEEEEDDDDDDDEVMNDEDNDEDSCDSVGSGKGLLLYRKTTATAATITPAPCHVLYQAGAGAEGTYSA